MVLLAVEIGKTPIQQFGNQNKHVHSYNAILYSYKKRTQKFFTY